MITPEILTAFEDATGLHKYARTTEESAALRADIRASLAVVAPMISDHTTAEAIELRKQLGKARELLSWIAGRLPRDEWPVTRREIDELLANTTTQKEVSA